MRYMTLSFLFLAACATTDHSAGPPPIGVGAHVDMTYGRGREQTRLYGKVREIRDGWVLVDVVRAESQFHSFSGPTWFRMDEIFALAGEKNP